MLHVELQALAGAMPSSVAITADVLATANRIRVSKGRPPVFALRIAGSGARGARGLTSAVGSPAPHERRADIVILASLVAVTASAVTERLSRRDAGPARRVIELALERGAEVAASCSAVFLLASTGALDGRRATTTWWLAPAFQRMFPRVTLESDEMVVRDGPVSTAGAAMAHLDLMLALVARHGGGELAQDCARFLLLDRRRSQSRYMAMSFLVAKDAEVARAESWARSELAQGVTVEGLSAAAGLSTRTFARRVAAATGRSPVQFLQRLRIERALELLESTNHSVEKIARLVGYAEPSTLRRLLRRDVGGRPSDLRA